jgi:hypothetical protein
MGVWKEKRPALLMSSATIDNTLALSSNATVAGTLGVTGAQTQSAGLTLSSALNVAGKVDFTSIQALTQATTNVINLTAPITTITATSAATNYQMPAPQAGVLKQIYCITATTTNTATVSFSGATGSTGYFFRGATGAAANIRKITMNASHEGVWLVGGSSAAAGYWLVASAINGPAFGTT